LNNYYPGGATMGSSQNGGVGCTGGAYNSGGGGGNRIV